MLKKDLGLGLIIGCAVGLLSQPIINNISESLVFFENISPILLKLSIFLIFAIAGPTGVYIGSLLGKFHPTIYQFTKFAATGTLNSFINLGVINILIILTGITSGNLYLLLVLVGFILATTNSFFWNKFWTFKAGEGGVQTKQTLSFYGLTAIGAFINIGVANFIVNQTKNPGLSLEVWANIGGLAGILAAFAWNFIGYKFFIFKKK